MANLLDYLHWRGDLPQESVPLNPADALILSCFVSLPLKNPLPPTLGKAAESVDSDFSRALARSPRFKDMQLYRFEEQFSETEVLQFAAITIFTGDRKCFISFRGTDSTLIGWKENFNMSFSAEVPAQREAVQYITRIDSELKLPMRIGGHSKGGNLAVYAAVMCPASAQKQIETVYNFDGPGLSLSAIQSDGYAVMESRIDTYLPESSIVGILLEHSARYRVVKSDAEGVLQHDPFSWQVAPDGFELLDELDRQSLFADRTIRDWLTQMSMEQRENFVDALYSILESTGARTLNEIDWQKSVPRMLETFGDLDIGTKAMLILSLGKLAGSAVRNLNTN